MSASSLCGSWKLKKRGSDYVPGVEDIVGVPFISQMIDESFGFHISQLTKPMEEIVMEHEHNGRRKSVYYQIGKTSFEDVTASFVILAAVVHISEDFTELSILRIGPGKGQRSLEQYKLSETGNEIRVEVDHVLPEGQAIKLVKRLERVGTQTTATIIFTNSNIVNHWALPQSHSPSTLRTATLRIVDVIQVVTEGTAVRRKQANLESDDRGSMIRKSSFSNSPPGSPSASMRRASLMHQNSGIVSLHKSVRRFKGELSAGETIQLYVIEVSLNGNSWRTYSRYREFEAFRQFINIELKDSELLSKLPPFPPKAMGKLRGKALEDRKSALENYLTFLCNVGGYNALNIVDALSSFLEIPEHTEEVSAVPKAQAVLRQQMLGNLPSFDTKPELYPKHVLTSMLSRGLRVIKFGRQGKPKERIMFNGVDDALAILYWADEQELIDHKARKAIGIPQGARSLLLRNVREIRRGTDLDPTRPGYCGTANLRKYCEPIDYAYCISLIFADRTFDIQLMSRSDYDSFVPNLTKHHATLLQQDTGGYNEMAPPTLPPLPTYYVCGENVSVETAERSRFLMDGNPKESSKESTLVPKESINLESFTEEERGIFKFLDDYRPRKLRIETPLKPFLPEYMPAIDTIRSTHIACFVKIPRPDGIEDGLGTQRFDEPEPFQSDPIELENEFNALIISEEGDDPPEGLDSLNILEKNELISEPDLIPPLVEIGSLESENHESEVSHAAPIDVIVSSDALPPVNTGRKLESVESANLRLYVESLVSNFLVESMKEYMKTNQPPPSISPRKNIQQQQQHVPQYIHEMLHSVLQNYLMKIAESSDPLSAHDVEDTSQPLSPTELTNDATASPPLATSPPEEVSDQRPESTQLLSEITKSYEEKIAIYEQKILELQSSYDELQRSTSETISNQASQLVDLNEKLEEKSTELKALHTHHNDMLSNELMLRREMDERISMIDEELQSVVHTWKLSSALSDLKIQEISEQLKYTQDDLSETIEYYRERERKAEEDAQAALAALPVLRDNSSQTDVDEIILQYEMRIKSLVDENQRYLQGVLEHQQLQDKYSLLENENNEIKKALLSFQDSCQLLTLKLNAANYEIELQNNELRVMRNEVTELRASCANMNQEMNHLQATHRELLNKIAMDTESIHNMKGSKLKLQNALKNLELENKLLHINYTALQSLECRSCHKSISQIYNESRQQEGSVEVVSTTKIGEDAFDTLPDELSQTDEIRQTESRLFEDSMKDMANNSRMMMNSSILLKSPEKKRENNAGCVSKSKATNSPPRGVSRNSKPARLKTPKLEAVVLPPTCAECRKRIKGDAKTLPTTLHNLDVNSVETVSPLSAEFVEMGFPARKAFLDNQVVKRDTFGHQPGQNCVFCSWPCARKWNQKNTPILQKYLIDQLICIAQGSF